MIDREFAHLRARLAHLRYLLVAQPPWYRDAAGAVWLDRLWARDLLRHCEYLADLTVLAPCLPLPDQVPADFVRLDGKPGLTFRHLPTGRSWSDGLRKLPGMLRAAIQAVRGADVVHSGAAGWPIPPGLVINPLAAALGKPLVIVVESAFWRGDGTRRGRMGRMMGAVTERLARWSVRRARLSIFTHESYARDLAQGARGRVMVAPASWVDEVDILTRADASAAWAAKPAAPRLLLAARLIEAKGVMVALQAMEAAEAQGLPIELDIIGEGPLAPQIQALAARSRLARLRLLDPVPYGPAFFRLLGAYHGVLVPSISDEQPRILFDAFAQAVPVLASDTPGHRAAVIPGETGLRFAAGDSAALLAVLSEVQARPQVLREMGMTARDRAADFTHRAMHLSRAQALTEVLSDPLSVNH